MNAPAMISPGCHSNVVVLCGSMSHFDSMCQVKDELLEDAVPVALPDTEDEEITSLDQASYNKFVGRAALNHLKRVRRRNTFAILVVNVDKHGIEDYIGPSTFAEIAAAASHRKRIFILNEFPAVYHDLLSAWNATPLHGRLDSLVQLYRGSHAAQRVKQLDLPV